MEIRMRSESTRSARGWTAIGLTLIITMFAGPGAAENQQEAAPSDVDVWRMIIRESIASYPHLCPCPYSPNRAGRSCGTRSAYSRVDGAVMCYVTDISDAEVARYRQRLNQNQSGSPQGQQQ
jgi:hypothetical protein